MPVIKKITKEQYNKAPETKKDKRGPIIKCYTLSGNNSVWYEVFVDISWYEHPPHCNKRNKNVFEIWEKEWDYKKTPQFDKRTGNRIGYNYVFYGRKI